MKYWIGVLGRFLHWHMTNQESLTQIFMRSHELDLTQGSEHDCSERVATHSGAGIDKLIRSTYRGFIMLDAPFAQGRNHTADS